MSEDKMKLLQENYRIVGDALNIILRETLSGYVAQELSTYYKKNWWQLGVLDELYDEQKSLLPEDGDFGELTDSLDIQMCFLLIKIHRDDIFSKKLSRNHFNWISELNTVRNQWAHTDWKAFDNSHTIRALDTMTRLCEQLDDENADKLREMWRKKFHAEVNEFYAENPTVTTGAGKKTAWGILNKPPGNLKSWRSVMKPHRDVSSGNYRQAEFTADLAQVARGEGSPEYRDPTEFFSRTYVTDGLNGLLQQALRRLIDGNGEPVIQLKTSFGGGKTHSMLALYHLFNGKIRPEKSDNVKKILAEFGAENIPKDILVAVVVGTNLNPSVSRRPPNMPGITINTMWGEIAAQLAFKSGRPELYNIIKEADKKGVSPGSDSLRELFDECGACLILIDELAGYGKKLYGHEERDIPAGTFDNFITFIQELTEAARTSRRTMVVASLPESEKEVGGTAGKEILKQVEHTFGRMESVWKPVTAGESFEVVRRRLFSECQDEDARNEICAAFGKMYSENPGDFPVETQELSYRQKMIDCYPIHPEFFDCLYNDWSTIDGFQRTRGVLRLMAGVIYYLWINNDSSCMIMPGSIPIYLPVIREELGRHLPENWNAIIDSEIDGKNSLPYKLDKDNPRFGELMAARRTARTIFLRSAPGVREQSNRGVYEKNIRLGVLQPDDGKNIAVFNDALSKLKSTLSYLYSDETGTRFWYDDRPTLRKLVLDLEQNISDESVMLEIERRVRSWRAQNYFGGIHICPKSSDVPDEKFVRLVILPPGITYSDKEKNSPAIIEATEILERRGNTPRQNKNMLLFMAADEKILPELKKTVKRFLAWQKIKDEAVQRNLDPVQIREANNSISQVETALKGKLSQTYCRILSPGTDKDGNQKNIEWEVHEISCTDESNVERAAEKFRDEENLIRSWGVFHLTGILEKLIWKSENRISFKNLWEIFSTYLYMPRLSNSEVLAETIKKGVHAGDFALAESFDEEKYFGLQFREEIFSVAPSSLIVKAEVAQKQIDGEQKNSGTPDETKNPDEKTGTENKIPDEEKISAPEEKKLPTHFSMDVGLDSVRINKTISDHMNNILNHLINLPDAKVTLRLDVDIKIKDGIPANVEEIVSENCQTSGIKNFKFE